MLSEKSRNMIVGLTLLVAMVLVGYGILMLGMSPSFLGGVQPYQITLLTAQGNGASPGTKVDLNGVPVGQVLSIDLSSDEAGKLQANIVLTIDGRYHIPTASTATIGRQIGLGSPYISLFATTGTPPFLPRDGSGVLMVSASDDANSLIPKEIREDLSNVSRDLRTVAKDFHILLAYNTPEQVEAGEGQEKPVENIATLVVRLNRTMKGLDSLLTDPVMHGQIREIVGNLRSASVQLNTTLKNVDTIATNADKAFSSIDEVTSAATKTLHTTQVQILHVSERMVDMISQMEKTTKMIAEGEGTTGKLINDPRLYESMIDLSKTLNTTTNDLNFLLKKWKDEGVRLHLK
ncbi:MAG: MlaD family protein [Phycisphaerales bacterium]|nr:MlaD family protein [Phycisphaerales bacterium]